MRAFGLGDRVFLLRESVYCVRLLGLGKGLLSWDSTGIGRYSRIDVVLCMQPIRGGHGSVPSSKK